MTHQYQFISNKAKEMASRCSMIFNLIEMVQFAIWIKKTQIHDDLLTHSCAEKQINKQTLKTTHDK
jgi:hypothetical protein